ncbi:hypothetical protein [Longimicrobium terrae]|uniref:HEAT repeat domain-containing protein n=1 Tax=Longimicrobium terrae TaxID=1639882 RepID=A0A841H401_9BACT|nr:hypothetical protein [Longimicrobium terrae]MBB4638427.1 hypothetical protein [Longimicrobium terrae]MBB6072730.1 hypothetical protein [Longimicrobium terrae]NNC32396.1 hypothetical protein [Longimicrobium terrae]
MAKYEAIPEWGPAEVEAAIARDRPEELLYAVVSASLYAEDAKWAESVCLRLATHPHFNVRGNALLGFGHIARVHRRLSRRQVLPLIEAGFHDPHEYVRGQAYGAADDIGHYLGWRIRRPE